MTIEQAYKESKRLCWKLYYTLCSYNRYYVSNSIEDVLQSERLNMIKEEYEDEFRRIEEHIIPDRQVISYHTPALDFDGDVVSMKAIMKDRERIRELETEVDKLKKANSKEILHDEDGNIIW